MGDIIFYAGIELNKKKLSDIGFLLVFPGFREWFFSMDLDFRINAC